MNILLNDLLTLSADYNGGHFIIKGVTGLGIADIRTSSFLFSGRSGGLVTDQFLGFRQIAINGEIGSNTMTLAQHAIDRKAMIDALPIGTTIPVYITTFSGATYRIDANVTDVKLEYKQRGLRSDFLIQLTAGDPLFYNTDGGSVHSAVVNRVTQGGYDTPYILPVSWASGSAPTIVNNTGDSLVYPVITLTGSAINPSIVNQLTGESFSLTLNMSISDVVVIDMGNRTVTLNGASIMGNRDAGSLWWGLQPGNNPLVLDSDSSGDTVIATVEWRNGVKGI